LKESEIETKQRQKVFEAKLQKGNLKERSRKRKSEENQKEEKLERKPHRSCNSHTCDQEVVKHELRK
jgi:hypothetical protein